MSIHQKIEKELEEARKDLQGKENKSLNLMFKTYSLDAVSYAKKYGVKLDFSEESVEGVEAFLKSFHEALSEEKPSQDQLLQMTKMFAGYIGEVIREKWGGEWDEKSAEQPTYDFKGNKMFLFGKVYKRIVNGPEDNLWFFYNYIFYPEKTKED